MNTRKMVLALSVAIALASCGGGGGGSGGGGQPIASGTAATGKAIAGAALTLKDTAGRSRTTTTTSDGSYSIDTTGFTAPFLLQVTTSSGTTLYSVSADAGAQTIINITPLTDLIVRSWYTVQGVSVDTAFNDPASNPAPSPTIVLMISKVVQDIVQLWLNQAGVTASGFNLISSSFDANGTGADMVLGQISLNVAAGTIRITDGTTTQNSTLTFANGAITISTTTTGANGTSSNTSTTIVPFQSIQQTTFDDIATLFTSFANTVNTKGASLQAGDILPYLDPGLLNNGLTQSQFAQQLAASLAGLTLSFTVQQITSLDTGNNMAEVVLQVPNGTLDFFFRKVNGTWFLSGNNRVTGINLAAEMRTNQGAYTGGNGPDINVDIQPPQGTVSGIAITGGNIWNNTALTQVATVVDATGNRDHFIINSGPLAQPPAAGTSFTVMVTKAAGGTESYTVSSNAFTNEAISITNITSGAIADAHLGSPLTVEWTLPETFPIASVTAFALAFTGDQTKPQTLQCTVNGPTLGITATATTITIPTTCSGLPVSEVNLNLNVTGINGEQDMVIHQFK